MTRTLGAAIADFLTTLDRPESAGTRRVYAGTLTALREHLGAEADNPDQAATTQSAAAADDLARRGLEAENEMARLLIADRPVATTTSMVTKPGNGTGGCAVCGAPISRASTGRPSRYCSPACRTRAWRTRTIAPRS